jgi:hypothetical protein
LGCCSDQSQCCDIRVAIGSYNVSIKFNLVDIKFNLVAIKFNLVAIEFNLVAKFNLVAIEFNLVEHNRFLAECHKNEDLSLISLITAEVVLPSERTPSLYVHWGKYLMMETGEHFLLEFVILVCHGISPPEKVSLKPTPSHCFA